MSTSISLALIQQKTGQYDPEVITRLSLCKLGLRSISNLERCASLVELDLSSNEITSMTGLDSLITLKRLDLSHNRISSIDECVTKLANLESLDLRGNAISNIDDISSLGMLPRLEKFSLRGSDGEDSNPGDVFTLLVQQLFDRVMSACQHPAYVSVVLRTLRTLTLLDGGLVGVVEETDTLSQRLAEIRPDASLCTTPPLERWFDDSAVEIDTDPRFADLVAEGGSGSSAAEAVQTVSDLLSIECKRLIFKADTALGRATK